MLVALELLELLEDGAIIPLIVAPAVFPGVGAVGAVGLEGPVPRPVIEDEESFPLHATADTSNIAAASPRQVMLRMAVLRHCLDPAFERVSMVSRVLWAHKTSQKRATPSPAGLAAPDPQKAAKIECRGEEGRAVDTSCQS
jgi:hypothetical protein